MTGDDFTDRNQPIFVLSSWIRSKDTLKVCYSRWDQTERFCSSLLRWDMLVAADRNCKVRPKGSADKATTADLDALIFKEMDTGALDLETRSFQRKIDAGVVIVVISEHQNDRHAWLNIAPQVSDAC